MKLKNPFQIRWAKRIILVFGIYISSCASAPQMPPPLRLDETYKIKDIYDVDGTDRESVKYYWVEKPTWSPIEKRSRTLSKNISIQEIIARPYIWGRHSTNEPILRIRKEMGVAYLLILPVPTGHNCYAKKLFVSQETFQDADLNPKLLLDSETVEAAKSRKEEEQVDCDLYDSIKNIFSRSNPDI